MAIKNTHNVQCATATGRVCRCTGCGGSEHGWQGWLDLSTKDRTSEADFAERGSSTEKKWRAALPRGPRGWSRASRQSAIDLARLDVSRWLRDKRPLSSRDVTVPPGGENPAAQLEDLTTSVVKPAWREIQVAIDDRSAAPVEIRRELADHVWCDLFVGLARVVAQFQDTIDSIPQSFKAEVARSVMNSSRHGRRSVVSAWVVDTLVDKVWDHFMALVVAQHSVLGTLTGPQLLRVLRILAVFCCPAPEDHEEVQRYAIDPLGQDAEEIVKSEAKDRLAMLFDDQ